MTAARSRKSRDRVAASNGARLLWIDPMWLVVSFIVLSLIAVIYNAHIVRTADSPLMTSTSRVDDESGKRHRRICRDRSIFISDASSGYAREAAVLLSQQGFHVLAGVKTEAQRRSFVYDVAFRKGLEPVVTDVSDPAQLANLLYRLRQVATDLGRPLYGILINSAAEIEYLSTGRPSDGNSVPPNKAMSKSYGKGKGRGKSKFLTPTQPPPDPLLSSSPTALATDSEAVDLAYRRLLRGPVRLLQAAAETGMWGTEVRSESGSGSRYDDCSSMIGRVVLMSPQPVISSMPPAARAMVSALHSLLISPTSTSKNMDRNQGQEGDDTVVAGGWRLGLGAAQIEVVEAWASGSGPASPRWALDLASSAHDPDRHSDNELVECNDSKERGQGQCRAGMRQRPIDASFSPQANALARAFLAQQPSLKLKL